MHRDRLCYNAILVNPMKRKAIALACLALAGLTWLALALPVFAQPPAQAVYGTPTAQPDGRIVYIVQAKDTCLGISLLMGIPLDQLRALNNLKGDCMIREGQELLLGKVAAETPTFTPGPSPTVTPILPSPTPFTGTGQVCIFLFNDINGNALREEGEVAIPDGAVSLTDRGGKYSKTLTTEAGESAVCLNDVPEGNYNISVAVPEGYNPTTVMNYALKLQAGDQSTLDFGAQLNSQALPLAPEEGGRSPILGIAGGLLLAAGVGLGLYVRVGKRPR